MNLPAADLHGPDPLAFADPGDDGLRLRRIPPGESLEEVQRLQREVLVEQLGIASEHATQRDDRLDASGTAIVVEHEGRAIAAVRMHEGLDLGVQVEFGRLLQLDRFASAWPLKQLMVGSHLVVQSDHRTLAVMDRLVAEAYRHALDHEAHFTLAACDPVLFCLFEYYGFREYLPPAVLPNGGTLLRMVLVAEDEPHLRQCESPLLRLVRDPAAGRAARSWIERTFPAPE